MSIPLYRPQSIQIWQNIPKSESPVVLYLNRKREVKWVNENLATLLCLTLPAHADARFPRYLLC